MQTYIAHYHSPKREISERSCGLFEFESDARIGSKVNAHDARVRMLEVFGSDALSWTIDKVERKQASKPHMDGQLALDFRTPAPAHARKPRRQYW